MDTPQSTLMDRGPPEIDIARQRYPYAVVWGPLGPLTCCCPCVGHMGIGDSEGRIHDFAGPYSIGVDNFMVSERAGLSWSIASISLRSLSLQVGTVWRYAQIRGADKDPDWDTAVKQADKKYGGMMHNICCNNCHHHTADALTASGRPHGLLSAWLLCFLHGNCTWC